MIDLIGDFRNVGAHKNKERLYSFLGPILREIQRILKKGGLVHVGEFYSPYESPEDIIDIFAKSGFEPVVMSDMNSSIGRNKLSQYKPKAGLTPYSYLLEFVKPQNTPRGYLAKDNNG